MNDLSADCREATRRYVRFFETLTPAALAELDRYFAPDARFKDPFNDVRGPLAIGRVFEHMFENTQTPRFLIEGWICEADTSCIRWQFRCKLQGMAIEFKGMSHVRFDSEGKVVEHIDYWDPAEHIYAKLPLLGGLMRYLRRRLAVPA